jgi:hypothetical protein
MHSMNVVRGWAAILRDCERERCAAGQATNKATEVIEAVDGDTKAILS